MTKNLEKIISLVLDPEITAIEKVGLLNDLKPEEQIKAIERSDKDDVVIRYIPFADAEVQMAALDHNKLDYKFITEPSSEEVEARIAEIKNELEPVEQPMDTENVYKDEALSEIIADANDYLEQNPVDEVEAPVEMNSDETTETDTNDVDANVNDVESIAKNEVPTDYETSTEESHDVDNDGTDDKIDIRDEMLFDDAWFVHDGTETEIVESENGLWIGYTKEIDEDNKILVGEYEESKTPKKEDVLITETSFLDDFGFSRISRAIEKTPDGNIRFANENIIKEHEFVERLISYDGSEKFSGYKLIEKPSGKLERIDIKGDEAKERFMSLFEECKDKFEQENSQVERDLENNEPSDFEKKPDELTNKDENVQEIVDESFKSETDNIDNNDIEPIAKDEIPTDYETSTEVNSDESSKRDDHGIDIISTEAILKNVPSENDEIYPFELLFDEDDNQEIIEVNSGEKKSKELSDEEREFLKSLKPDAEKIKDLRDKIVDVKHDLMITESRLSSNEVIIKDIENNDMGSAYYEVYTEEEIHAQYEYSKGKIEEYKAEIDNLKLELNGLNKQLANVEQSVEDKCNEYGLDLSDVYASINDNTRFADAFFKEYQSEYGDVLFGDMLLDDTDKTYENKTEHEVEQNINDNVTKNDSIVNEGKKLQPLLDDVLFEHKGAKIEIYKNVASDETEIAYIKEIDGREVTVGDYRKEEIQYIYSRKNQIFETSYFEKDNQKLRFSRTFDINVDGTKELRFETVTLGNSISFEHYLLPDGNERFTGYDPSGILEYYESDDFISAKSREKFEMLLETYKDKIEKYNTLIEEQSKPEFLRKNELAKEEIKFVKSLKPEIEKAQALKTEILDKQYKFVTNGLDLKIDKSAIRDIDISYNDYENNKRHKSEYNKIIQEVRDFNKQLANIEQNIKDKCKEYGFKLNDVYYDMLLYNDVDFIDAFVDEYDDILSDDVEIHENETEQETSTNEEVKPEENSAETNEETSETEDTSKREETKDDVTSDTNTSKKEAIFKDEAPDDETHDVDRFYEPEPKPLTKDEIDKINNATDKDLLALYSKDLGIIFVPANIVAESDGRTLKVDLDDKIGGKNSFDLSTKNWQAVDLSESKFTSLLLSGKTNEALTEFIKEFYIPDLVVDDKFKVDDLFKDKNDPNLSKIKTELALFEKDFKGGFKIQDMAGIRAIDLETSTWAKVAVSEFLSHLDKTTLMVDALTYETERQYHDLGVPADVQEKIDALKADYKERMIEALESTKSTSDNARIKAEMDAYHEKTIDALKGCGWNIRNFNVVGFLLGGLIKLFGRAYAANGATTDFEKKARIRAFGSSNFDTVCIYARHYSKAYEKLMAESEKAAENFKGAERMIDEGRTPEQLAEECQEKIEALLAETLGYDKDVHDAEVNADESDADKAVAKALEEFGKEYDTDKIEKTGNDKVDDVLKDLNDLKKLDNNKELKSKMDRVAEINDKLKSDKLTPEEKDKLKKELGELKKDFEKAKKDWQKKELEAYDKYKKLSKPEKALVNKTDPLGKGLMHERNDKIDSAVDAIDTILDVIDNSDNADASDELKKALEEFGREWDASHIENTGNDKVDDVLKGLNDLKKLDNDKELKSKMDRTVEINDKLKSDKLTSEEKTDLKKELEGIKKDFEKAKDDWKAKEAEVYDKFKGLSNDEKDTVRKTDPEGKNLMHEQNAKIDSAIDAIDAMLVNIDKPVENQTETPTENNTEPHVEKERENQSHIENSPEFQRLLDENNKLRQENADLKQENTELKGEIAELKARLDKVDGELENLNKKVEALEADNKDLRSELSDKNAKDEFDAKLESLKSEFKDKFGDKLDSSIMDKISLDKGTKGEIESIGKALDFSMGVQDSIASNPNKDVEILNIKGDQFDLAVSNGDESVIYHFESPDSDGRFDTFEIRSLDGETLMRVETDDANLIDRRYIGTDKNVDEIIAHRLELNGKDNAEDVIKSTDFLIDRVKIPENLASKKDDDYTIKDIIAAVEGISPNEAEENIEKAQDETESSTDNEDNSDKPEEPNDNSNFDNDDDDIDGLID